MPDLQRLCTDAIARNVAALRAELVDVWCWLSQEMAQDICAAFIRHGYVRTLPLFLPLCLSFSVHDRRTCRAGIRLYPTLSLSYILFLSLCTYAHKPRFPLISL